VAQITYHGQQDNLEVHAPPQEIYSGAEYDTVSEGSDAVQYSPHVEESEEEMDEEDEDEQEEGERRQPLPLFLLDENQERRILTDRELFFWGTSAYDPDIW